MSPPAFLTVAEAATVLGLSRDAVYALCRAARIGHRRLGPKGGMIRFTRADIDENLESARVPAVELPRRGIDPEDRPHARRGAVGLGRRGKAGGLTMPDGSEMRYF